MAGANEDAVGAVQVRAMIAEDIAAVMAIARELAEAPQWPEAMWREMLADVGVRRVARIAEDERGVVGFGVASVVMELAELELIAVARAAQRRGVGRMLLEAVVEACARAGAERMLLEVRASNEAALGLYRSAGFAVTGRRTGYYREPVEDAVCMECTLRGALFQR